MKYGYIHTFTVIYNVSIHNIKNIYYNYNNNNNNNNNIRFS